MSERIRSRFQTLKRGPAEDCAMHSRNNGVPHVEFLPVWGFRSIFALYLLMWPLQPARKPSLGQNLVSLELHIVDAS